MDRYAFSCTNINDNIINMYIGRVSTNKISVSVIIPIYFNR